MAARSCPLTDASSQGEIKTMILGCAKPESCSHCAAAGASPAPAELPIKLTFSGPAVSRSSRSK
jgi:hypothetical protein